MTDRIKEAEAQADAFEKERRRQLEQQIAAAEATAKATVEAAEASAATQRETAEAAERTAWDTAAVQRAVTERQAREKLANLGLARSGASLAAREAAYETEKRARTSARRTREAAVAKLAESVRRTTAEAEAKRDTAIAKETASAEKAILEQRDKLVTKAQESVWREEEKKQESEWREKQLFQREESNRRDAIYRLYLANKLTPELYARAIDSGWSVATALEKQEEIVKYNRVVGQAATYYQNEGLDAMIRYLSPQDMSDDEIRALCHTLDLSYDTVSRRLRAFRNFVDSSSAAQELLKDFERRPANAYADL